MGKVRALSPELQQIANTELNEIPREIDDEIEVTLNLIDGQPGLTKYEVSDQFILSFLRACKYNQSTIKKKLPNYITMRKISPDIFANRGVNEDIIDIIRKGVHLPLPVALENGSLINISNYGNLNLKQHSIYEGIKLLFMMLELRFLEDDRSSVAGFTFIEDFSDLSFSHMVAMNIGVLKKIMGYIRSGMPYRVKAIHIINAPWFVNGIMGLFRDILPLKMKKRFFIHKKITDLYTHVPQRLLPKEYGGECGSVEDITKTWVSKMQDYGEYFNKDLKFGTDIETGIDHKTSVGNYAGIENHFCTEPQLEAEISTALDFQSDDQLISTTENGTESHTVSESGTVTHSDVELESEQLLSATENGTESHTLSESGTVTHSDVELESVASVEGGCVVEEVKTETCIEDCTSVEPVAIVKSETTVTTDSNIEENL